MNFNVGIAELSSALQRALPVIPPKSTLPVLEHLHLSLKGNVLEIVATDQDITILSRLPVEGGEDGEVLAPARKFSDIIKALGSEGTISFSINPENLTVEIKSRRGSYKMKGLPSMEYLELPELFETAMPEIDQIAGVEPDKNYGVFKAGELSRLAQKTVFAVSGDEYRIAMTGVLMQFRGNQAIAVATDSFRLVKAVTNAENNIFPTEFDVILPSRAIDLMKRIDSEVTISAIDASGKVTHMRFDTENMTIISRIIDEKYPPYQSVIPSNNDKSATLDIAEFLKAIKRVSIFANVTTKQIKLTFENSSCTLVGEDEESGNKATEQINCDYAGETMTVGFNYKFLEDALHNISQEDTTDNLVEMLFSTATKPVLLVPKNEKNELLMLIMPVRLASE